MAKNTGNINSDIDLYVIVNDKEYAKRKLTKNYFCGSIFEQSNYPVYIDGKVINKDYLKRIWTDGNECIKNTFSQVKLLYSLDNEINGLINNVDKIYSDRNENIR